MNADKAYAPDKPTPTPEFLELADAIYEEAKRIDPSRKAQCERAMHEELRHAPRSY